MIRPARAEDVTPCWGLIQEFYALSEFGDSMPPDEQKCRRLLARCAGSPTGFLWVVECDGEVCGAMAGIINEATWSNAKVVSDLFFYVRDPASAWAGLLVLAYRKWCRKQNVRAWGFSFSAGSIELTERAELLADTLGLHYMGGTYLEVFQSCQTH